jgi:hypothetical protein
MKVIEKSQLQANDRIQFIHDELPSALRGKIFTVESAFEPYKGVLLYGSVLQEGGESCTFNTESRTCNMKDWIVTDTGMLNLPDHYQIKRLSGSANESKDPVLAASKTVEFPSPLFVNKGDLRMGDQVQFIRCDKFGLDGAVFTVDKPFEDDSGGQGILLKYNSKDYQLATNTVLGGADQDYLIGRDENGAPEHRELPTDYRMLLLSRGESAAQQMVTSDKTSKIANCVIL